MFDLEAKIAEWRKQMRAAGVEQGEEIEELETHLREEIERRMRIGATAQEAFELACREVGPASILGAEFDKVSKTKRRKQMTRTLAILVALFATNFGGAMVLPALGRWRDTGTLVLGPPLIGTTLVIAGACAAIYGIKGRRASGGITVLTFSTILAGAFYLVPLILAFFHDRSGLLDWVVCGAMAVASVLFYGRCLFLIRRSRATT